MPARSCALISDDEVLRDQDCNAERSFWMDSPSRTELSYCSNDLDCIGVTPLLPCRATRSLTQKKMSANLKSILSPRHHPKPSCLKSVQWHLPKIDRWNSSLDEKPSALYNSCSPLIDTKKRTFRNASPPIRRRSAEMEESVVKELAMLSV